MKQRIATTPSQARRLMGRGLLSTTADMSYTKRRGGVLTVTPYVRQPSLEAWPAWSLSALLEFLCDFSFDFRVRKRMSPEGGGLVRFNVLLEWPTNDQWGMYFQMKKSENSEAEAEAFSQADDPIEAVVRVIEDIFSGKEGKELLSDCCSLLEPVK